MSTAALTSLIARCRVLCRPRSQSADSELLLRFTKQRDAAAFEELLERHAVLVWSVCRRILHNETDCEDAFQSTFLALVRHAGAIDARPSLGAWLHTVAMRVARKTLARAQRQRPQALVLEPATPGDVADDVGSRELFRVVDEEIERLPASLRVPIILCCLEGRTRDEAAERLGCSIAAVKSRLERGRTLLRQRLERRGVHLPSAFLVLGLTSERIRAALWAKTMQSVLYAPSPGIATLAASGVSTVAPSKSKLFLATLLLVTSASVAGTLWSEKPAEPEPSPPTKRVAVEPKKAEQPPTRADRHGDPLPDGAIARLGTVRWRHGFTISGLAYSPDGTKIAAIGAGRALTLWDAATGKEVAQFPNINQPNSMAYSPDGKIIATTDNPNCYLWDAATGKELRRLKCGQDVVRGVAFSPDGKWIATASADGTMRLWDKATGKELRQIDGACEFCRLAYSPDGKCIASTSMDGTLRIWDPDTGKELRRLAGHKKPIWSVIFSPDSKRLATTGDDGTIRLWDVATGQQSRVLAVDLGAERPIAFSPDGISLASGHLDGSIRLWDVRDGAEKRQWHADSLPVRAIQFAPDGKTLASGSAFGRIRLWDAATGSERFPSEDPNGFIDFVQYSSDGSSLVSTSTDRRVMWWDLATQAPVHQIAWTAKTRSRTALSPDGNTLAVGGWSDPERQRWELQLWDARTGKSGRLLGKYPGGIYAIAFSPDSRLVASGGNDHVIHVWDASNGKEVRQITGVSDDVWCLCFSPDNKSIACGTYPTRIVTVDPALHVWDLASGKERCRFDMHFSFVTALAFSPDGKTIAAGERSRDGTYVRLWDTATGKEVCRHLGHREDVCGIAFSPDGKLIVSGAGSIGTKDNSVHVWEAVTGRLIRRFEGHHSCVGTVAFSPRGLTVASGAGDSTILLWDITDRRADGRWHTKALTPHELEVCWTDLAKEDAAKAYDAVWALVASSDHAVTFLRKHLPSTPQPDAKKVAQWIADLDSNEFSARRNATEELSRLGDVIAPALKRALDGKPSLEVRRRLQQLLDQTSDWTADRLRDHRAIHVLEYIGTRQAIGVLRNLSGGAPGTLRTEEAKTALRRFSELRP